MSEFRYIQIADNVFCSDGSRIDPPKSLDAFVAGRQLIQIEDAFRQHTWKYVVSLDRNAGEWVTDISHDVLKDTGDHYVNRIVRHIPNPYRKKNYVKDEAYIRDTAKLILTLAQDAPVFFHCMFGKDRTGFVRDAIMKMLDPKTRPSGMDEGDELQIRMETDEHGGVTHEHWHLD
jgi:hypothetical protein